MGNNNFEGLVIKYSLGSAFVGVTALFAVKIVMMLGRVAKQELIKFKDWLLTGEFALDFLGLIKNILFGG